MILTVTLNPLVERRFEYESILPGTSNRNPSSDFLAAGGKGINVSRQLNMLGLDNLAFTFTGGATGKIFRKLIADENIKASFIQIQEETRTSTVVTDSGNVSVTTFFGQDPEISPGEADEFIQRLGKMISSCEILVLSGSSPSENTDMIFPAAIDIANKLDKISFLDTYGAHLENCIKASPTVLHNNADELAALYNMKDEAAVLKSLDELYKAGIRQAFITNGAAETYASAFDFHYKITNPLIDEKDATGSGDAFTAGIVYGWHNNLTFEETAIIASCLGAANASFFSVCKVDMETAEKYRQEVKIEPVGKKMKILDVTPK